MNVNTPIINGGFSLPGMKKPSRSPSSRASTFSDRVPFLNVLPPGTRNHFVAMCGEFTGTFLFLFFAFAGTQVASTRAPGAPEPVAPDTSALLYIALSFGFSLAVNAWVFFRISGGLFNPAVTLAMCLVAAVPWPRGCLVVVSQILGGIAAAGIVSALFPHELNVRTSLGGGTSVTRGLFIEMFLTAQLVFTIFMLAAEKHRGTFIAPVGIGLSLFVAELTGVWFTGGSVNPARSFGPSVVTGTFHTYHWIYWVGPVLGALLASGFYKFIKMLEYETANPGQDDHVPVEERFDPEAFDEGPEAGHVSFAMEDVGKGHHSREGSGAEDDANGGRGPMNGRGVRLVEGQGPLSAMKGHRKAMTPMMPTPRMDDGEQEEAIMPAAGGVNNGGAEDAIMPTPWVRREVLGEGTREEERFYDASELEAGRMGPRSETRVL